MRDADAGWRAEWRGPGLPAPPVSQDWEGGDTDAEGWHEKGCHLPDGGLQPSAPPAPLCLAIPAGTLCRARLWAGTRGDLLPPPPPYLRPGRLHASFCCGELLIPTPPGSSHASPLHLPPPSCTLCLSSTTPGATQLHGPLHGTLVPELQPHSPLCSQGCGCSTWDR